MEKIENQPIAKTQTFIIRDTDKEIIMKMLKSEFLNISFKSIDLPKKTNKEDFYKKIHKEIKEIIKNINGSHGNKKYNIIIDKKSSKCFFFFISDQKNNTDELLSNLYLNNLDLKGVIACLFSLAMKNKIINNITEYYNITPSYYNDKFYLGTKIQNEIPNKNNKVFVDTFEYSTYFSQDSKLSFNLKSKTFLVDIAKEMLINDIDFNGILFKKNLNIYNINDDSEVDAKRYNKSKFMQYKQKYPESSNYSLNFLHKNFIELFNVLNIEYEEVFFQANYKIKNSIHILTLKNNIV